MADNTELNPGSGGDIVAADDVAGVKYQVVKLDLGAGGASAPVAGALPVSGTVELGAASLAALETVSIAGTVPVSAAALPLPAGASTEATLAALQTLLTTIAGTIQSHNSVFTDGSAGQVILGKRRDSDSTLVADGDLNTFNMDEEGRLKVSSKPASYPDITGDITAIQATIGTPVAG